MRWRDGRGGCVCAKMGGQIKPKKMWEWLQQRGESGRESKKKKKNREVRHLYPCCIPNLTHMQAVGAVPLAYMVDAVQRFQFAKSKTR